MLIPVRTTTLARCAAAGLLLLLSACITQSPTQTPTPLPETAVPTHTSLPPAPPTDPPPTPTPLPSDTPTSEPTATAPPLPSETPIPTLTPSPTPIPVGPYAVVRVEPNDTLNVRAGPGVSYPVLARLAYNAQSVMLTTRTETVDGSLWAEIVLGEGQVGWVNDYYLTRYTTTATFCGDTRMQALLDRFETALVVQDGSLLAQAVSPRHGLDLMAFRTGNIIYFNHSQIAGLFTNPVVFNWGVHPASALEVQGTFASEILPDLAAALSASYTLSCDQPGPGINAYPDAWPARYTNLHYLAVFKPGTPGIDLDWVGWLVGVEYVDSQPYLTVLIRFFWEP